MLEDEKYRKEFILRMYARFWDNVARAEDSAWRMFAAYIGIFAALYFFSSLIGVFGVLVVFLIFSSMAVLLMIRANLWYARNLGLISNIEKEFLYKDDYGRLLPFYFKKKPIFLNKEIYNIQAVSYYFIYIGVLLTLWSELNPSCQQVILFLLAICTALIFIYGIVCCWYLDYRRFIVEAKGKDVKVRWDSFRESKNDST